MKPILTPKEMSAADRATVEQGTPSLELMERAGAAVARAALRLGGGAYGRRIAILCGTGNNGGDGFVAARRLAAMGAFPVVLIPDRGFSGDAATNFQRLQGIRVRRLDADNVGRELGRAHVVIDAMVGTGFRGELKEVFAFATAQASAGTAPVVAVDVPSGVDALTGTILGPAVKAKVTVTMGALKPGLLLHPGCEYAGQIEVADIGIPGELLPRGFCLVEPGDVAGILPRRDPADHKRSVGTVLVVAGSVGMFGAAALTASAALRAGAGLVTIAAPASVALMLDQSVIEATTLPLPETGRGTIEASAVDVVLERAERADAVALGPGLSTDPETVEFVGKLVSECDRAMVVDADALNALGGSTDILARRSSPTLLTPHPGELGRLIGVGTDEIQADRLAAGRRASSETGAAVLLKGYRTIVSEPSGNAALIDVGGPALATGGSGDVLTGICAALLAGGRDPFSAGWAGAWIHGSAGDLLASASDGRGVMAGDLLDAIPEAMNRAT